MTLSSALSAAQTARASARASASSAFTATLASVKSVRASVAAFAPFNGAALSALVSTPLVSIGVPTVTPAPTSLGSEGGTTTSPTGAFL